MDLNRCGTRMSNKDFNGTMYFILVNLVKTKLYWKFLDFKYIIQ